jgi:predicted CXXCH cytochrome family protein
VRAALLSDTLAAMRCIPIRALVLLGGAALLSCQATQRRSTAALAGAPARLQSNVLRTDYAGSAACAPCHADIYARWQRSPMHNMTRLPERAAIGTPFDDAVFHFKDDRVVLSRKGSERLLRIESPRFGDHLFRITKVIGGRHREDFAGVELREPGSAAPGPLSADERVLPISYMLGAHQFRYKGYSVMSPERPGLRPGAVWNKTCIFCHNTVPYLSTILGALAGPGTPPYQGEVVDPLLPPERRQRFAITDEAGLRAAVTAELSFLGRRAPESLGGAEPSVHSVLQQGVRGTRALFQERHLVEVGIGCESCHGGSKEHVADTRRRPSLTPRSALFTVQPEPQNHAQQVNRVCARCHQVLFSRYSYTWEGGLRSQEPGGSNINSGEGRDFLLGACAGQMSCTTCHDPHAPDEENQRRLKELAGPAGNAVCTRCHPQYKEAAALRAHAHHDPSGPGGLCMNCHMVQKNMSLDTRLGRYHRIGSPTDKNRVLADRPLECALCHGDRTVEQLVTDMERMYGKTYDRTALQRLYGNLDQNVLLDTLQHGKAHEQVVAIAVLGRDRRKDALPLLQQQLVHPYPLLRYYVQRALEQITGAPAPADFDLHQDNARILAAAASWLGASTAPPLERPDGRSGAAPPMGQDEE